MDKSDNLWYNNLNKVMSPEEKQRTASEIVYIVKASVQPVIEKAVNKYVNGKIDSMSKDLKTESKARAEADEAIHIKLDSIVSVADWFRKLGKGVVYAGILAAAITAVIVLVKQVT